MDYFQTMRNFQHHFLWSKFSQNISKSKELPNQHVVGESNLKPIREKATSYSRLVTILRRTQDSSKLLIARWAVELMLDMLLLPKTHVFPHFGHLKMTSSTKLSTISRNLQAQRTGQGKSLIIKSS